VRTAGHSVNLAILVDNIEASKAHGLAQAGLLVAEASVGHQAGLLAHLLWEGEVLSAALVVVVTPETSMAVEGLEVLTEEVMEEAAMLVEVEEATVKLKEKVSEEGPMWAFLFVQFLLARILIFTNYYKGYNPTDIVKRLGDFFLKSCFSTFTLL
jgi:hypothetical protein